MSKQWQRQLDTLSGNLTTNGCMPQFIVNKLLEEDIELKEKILFEDVVSAELGNELSQIKGLNILASLQNLNQKSCLSVFRAIRFPTCKRIHDVLSKYGYAASNYEQERILHFYRDGDYTKKRNEIRRDNRFWTQPQERVVQGLPLFSLVNDALQIHRAFRGEDDQVIIAVLHIPYELIESRWVRFIANAGIDLDYGNTARDFETRDFVKKDGVYRFDYSSLRARGIDLHELYAQGLPWDIVRAKKIGIGQEFFLLHVYKIKNHEKINKLLTDSDVLKRNQFFLHGFLGDQNIFGRRRAEYLPNKCQRLQLKR